MIILLTILQAFSNPTQAQDFSWLLHAKKNCRQDIMGRRSPNPRMPFYSPILSNDRAEDLVEVPSKLIKNLQVMERNQLLSKELSVAPWSDTYWPLYLGAAAQRYHDQKFTGLDWNAARSYVAKNSIADLVKKKQTDLLAPSEKYDLLMGLTENTLTASNWAEGESYFRQYGTVETWMGLCHGWAAAAIMMPNPVRRVELNTTAGAITFYPTDIKAMGTLLWAKGNAQSRFIGGRCNTKNPSNDTMGRPKEIDCLDNNPGTWHMAIVNQIGQFNRSFVMDATFDYQVWNQPVFGYSYTYYNPKTGVESTHLKDAIIKKTDWAADPRKSVRAENAQYLVGIKMNVNYVVENSPNQEENQPSEFSDVDYQYDLELNSQLEIVGGEWYSSDHPDFLWVPERNAFPQTYGDSNSVVVDLNNPSAEVKRAAKMNASYELPFGAVVRAFFRASSGRN